MNGETNYCIQPMSQVPMLIYPLSDTFPAKVLIDIT